MKVCRELRYKSRLVPAQGPGVVRRRAAVLTVGGWTITGGVLGAVTGEATGVLVGLGLGGVAGSLAGVGVFGRCHAQAQAAAGAVAVGERKGVVGVAQPLVIARETRVRHLAVFGPTGSGKSTVIKNLVRQDAAAPGRPGLLVVDVKDDLVLDIAAHLPEHRIGDVLLFDPADIDFPPAFNPLAGVAPEGRTPTGASEVRNATTPGQKIDALLQDPRLDLDQRAQLSSFLVEHATQAVNLLTLKTAQERSDEPS